MSGRPAALVSLVLSLAWAAPAAAGPGMGWGQWTSPDLTFAECMTRAPSALRAEGFTTVERYGRIWFGSSGGPVSATIVCYGLAKGTIVTISAANQGNSGPSGATVGRLADRIFIAEEPKPTPGSAPVPNPPPPAAEPADWSTSLVPKRAPNGKVGDRFTYDCPPNPEKKQGRVWGTDLYTDDSSICTAAVHAGLITFGKGGKVTVEKRPGVPLYIGSDRRDVASSNYDNRPNPFPGSFVFVEAPK